jgi:hypothetical protein
MTKEIWEFGESLEAIGLVESIEWAFRGTGEDGRIELKAAAISRVTMTTERSHDRPGRTDNTGAKNALGPVK